MKKCIMLILIIVSLMIATPAWSGDVIVADLVATICMPTYTFCVFVSAEREALYSQKITEGECPVTIEVPDVINIAGCPDE